MTPVVSVSVVVPFFNRSRFLRRLIQSISQQTFSIEEVFIIDNGSSVDELACAGSIISDYLAEGFPIIWCSTLRKGNANIARNLGLDLASTTHVAFLDSDDWWEPRHIESSLEVLAGGSKAASYSGAVVHYPGRVVYKVSVDVNDCEYFGDFLYRRRGSIAQTSSYVVDKKKLKGVRWDEELKRSQDIDFFISVSMLTSGWQFVPFQNVHFDIADGGAKNIDFRSLIRFFKKWENNFLEQDKRRYFSRQIITCIRRKSPRMYTDYYKARYIGKGFGRNWRALICCLRYFERREMSILAVRKILRKS